MDKKPSSLPMATRDLDDAARQIAEIKTPLQAENKKLWFSSLQKLFEKHGLFEMGFKASEYWTEADRKLWGMLGKSGLTTEKALAEALRTNKTSIKTLRHDLKRAYDKPEETLEALKRKAFEKGEYLTRKWFMKDGQTGHFSGDPEWYTPPWLYERARLIMGGIDLDPATHQKAIKMGNKATRYFTKEDDGLKQDWGKGLRIFCNPPFTLDDKKTPGVLPFLNKLLAADYSQAIFVTPEDSSVSHGQILWRVANVVFIPTPRVHFIRGGVIEKKPQKTTLVWGLGVDADRFLMAFRGYGRVMKVQEFKETFEEMTKKFFSDNIKSLTGIPEKYGMTGLGPLTTSVDMKDFARKLKSLPQPPANKNL